MSELVLRPYQEKALKEIRNLFAIGTRRVLLHLATGGGKTLCFCTMLKAANAKGTKSLLVVRGKSLVHQASERLFAENVDHGMFQGANTWNTSCGTIVASVDTLHRRQIAPEADFVVIDEAHLTFGKAYEWLLDQYQGKFILGVSATPHNKKKGMRHIADAVVYPISIKDLMAQKYLAEPKYYAPEKPDLSEVKISKATNDYDTEQLGEVMEKIAVKGKVIAEYFAKAKDLPTLLFAVNIKHSNFLKKKFEERGVKVAHIDAKTPDAERKRILSELQERKIDLVTNVGVCTTGVDIPYLGAIICCRPTQSYNLWIQMLGRGTRRPPGKDTFLVLDHAGNVFRHGLIENEQMASLDPQEKKSSKNTQILPNVMIKECPVCMAIYDKNLDACPSCGAENEKEEVKRKTGEDENFNMVEITEPPEELFLKDLLAIARRKGFKKGWLFHKIAGRFGKEAAEKLWPKIRAQKRWQLRTIPDSSNSSS